MLWGLPLPLSSPPLSLTEPTLKHPPVLLTGEQPHDLATGFLPCGPCTPGVSRKGFVESRIVQHHYACNAPDTIGFPLILFTKMKIPLKVLLNSEIGKSYSLCVLLINIIQKYNIQLQWRWLEEF